MSGGSYASCDGCYEETDNLGKTIFVKSDKSRFLAQQDDVWAGAVAEVWKIAGREVHKNLATAWSELSGMG